MYGGGGGGGTVELATGTGLPDTSGAVTRGAVPMAETVEFTMGAEPPVSSGAVTKGAVPTGGTVEFIGTSGPPVPIGTETRGTVPGAVPGAVPAAAVEFKTSAENPVPIGAVPKGAVPIGVLVREASRPLRSPKLLLNSSSVAIDVGSGGWLAGALVVSFADGNTIPPEPVDRMIDVDPEIEIFSAPTEGPVGAGADTFRDGSTIPPPEATEDSTVSPEVTNTAVPTGREPFELGLGVALTEAGTVMLADGSGIAPVDATSSPEASPVASPGASPVASSENWKTPKGPPPSSSSVVVLLELGVGAKPETDSETNSVGVGMEILTEATGMTPDVPVERITSTEATTTTSETDAVALRTGASLAGAVPEGTITPNPPEADVTAVPPDTVKF